MHFSRTYYSFFFSYCTYLLKINEVGKRTMNQHLYHFKPKEMVGPILYPLNALKSTFPDVFSEEVRKYKGRDRLLKKIVPILNCLWNDVLHLSPINPQIVLNTWRQEGVYPFDKNPISFEIYRIPVKKISNKNSVYYHPLNFDFNNYDPSLDKVWSFLQEDYSELQDVDPRQIEVWKEDNRKGLPLLWYSHSIHVLTKQNIDISDCETITCK